MQQYPPAWLRRAGKQLTQEQRYGIKLMLNQGFNQIEIAEHIGVHQSTISREVRRNRGKRGYRYKQAHALALDRRKGKIKPPIDGSTWAFIETLIRNDYSPEQIHGWMKENLAVSVSHEWIYQYILQDKQTGGDLYTHLRCKRKRKKRYGSNDRRGQIKNRVSIDARPSIVETRSRIGDWEADTLIGKRHKQAIVSLTERKSGLALLYKVKQRTKEETEKAMKRLLGPLKDRVHTITSDNGKEFANHETIAKDLECGFYFAHAYSSWERGTNENTNGLIRQYFPKDRDFRTITDDEIIHTMQRLNNRPRKRLGFKTPNQVFFGKNQQVACLPNRQALTT
ncbi:MAG: IS30 family transposase [Candidatus Marinimicrobia bacterium]|nr:IS30 family transposase [Candidatus Neomarinimicrobiota bacterium]